MIVGRGACFRTAISVLFALIAGPQPALALSGGLDHPVADNGARPPYTIPKERLFDLFATACENGSVVLKPDEATPLSGPDIPHELHSWYIEANNPRYYRIDDVRPSYLIVFDGFRGNDAYKSGCALATTAYDFFHLWIYAAKRPYTKDIQPGNLTRLQLVSPHDGYAIEAQDIGRFGVLQVSMLDAAQAAKLEADTLARYKAYRKKHPKALPPGIVP